MNISIKQTKSNKELSRRIWFLILALIVYRLGAHIPVPGVDLKRLQDMFNSGGGGLSQLFNLFSGGALERMSVFSLGIMPYISASIIMQMLTYVVPMFEQMKKEGESGRKKITQFTRYAALGLALIQSIITMVGLEAQNVVIDPGLAFRAVGVVSLTSGAMFMMWLGEQITERGVGNGISILIFSGIVAGLPGAIGGFFELTRNGSLSAIAGLAIVAIVVAGTFFVVYFEQAVRKVLVNYAKRQVGQRIVQPPSSPLMLKVNMAGVIPPIFASSIILLPATIISWGSISGNLAWLRDFAAALDPREPIYMMVYSALIVFFCFFYTGLVFNSRETADNLKKSSAIVPGKRPGEQTAKYLDKVLLRLTLIGAIYMCVICVLPLLLGRSFPGNFAFGGTSLLIIVVVAMDFMTQVRSYMFSHQYEGLLRKANFRR